MIPTQKRSTAKQLLRRKVTDEKCRAAGGQVVKSPSPRYTMYRFADGSEIAVPKITVVGWVAVGL